MTPLERAARALHSYTIQVKRIRDPERPNDSPIEVITAMRPWEDLTAAERQSLFDQVRAVLTAIREPSEAILKAMRDTVPVDGFEWEYRDEEAVEHWQAMIDAALAEEE